MAIALAAAMICLAALSPFIVTAIVSRASRQVVVIDAGHGGEDAGVRGVLTGVKESDLNLSVSKLLGECFEGCGFEVVYTRRSDVMHSFDGVTGNKKRADMFRRGDMINKAKPRAVISVHMNFYELRSRRGAQAFFKASSPSSRQFADFVQDGLNELNMANGGRTYSALSAEKYLLSCSPYPTVIVECGFLSNPDDEKNLLDPAYQITLARTIFQATLNFFNCAQSA